MKVPVITETLDISAIADALREYGLVVVETGRVHALDVRKELEQILGIDRESEEGAFLSHASTEAEDRGWSEFFAYSEAYEYLPGKTEELVVVAVSQWVAAGQPETFYAQVRA